jgi:hypothetical protein
MAKKYKNVEENIMKKEITPAKTVSITNLSRSRLDLTLINATSIHIPSKSKVTGVQKALLHPVTFKMEKRGEILIETE